MTSTPRIDTTLAYLQSVIRQPLEVIYELQCIDKQRENHN